MQRAPSTSLRALAVLALSWAAMPAAAAPQEAPPEPAAIAAAVEVAAEGAKTRFSITLSKPVAARAFAMERPDRIILDLPEVAFHVAPKNGRGKAGLIASYRYGLFAPGRSRVVMDLSHPAQVSRVDVATNPDGSAQLTVELAKADREAFRRSAEAAAPPPARRSAAPPAAAKDRPVIVLDPGHGGIDPGAAAVGGGMVEKDIVFDFAQLLRRRLEGGGRYRVVLTRDQDVFIPLAERVNLARAAGADLFVSIHADSISGAQEVRGLTVYTGSERASDADSARLADRENRSDAAAGAESADGADDILDILQDLTLRETRAYSHAFASRLVGELEGVSRLTKNPHRQAGFRVLRAHDVPSVLVELGYLTSRKDFDLLMSGEWREKTTNAMAEAIDRFFAARLARTEGR